MIMTGTVRLIMSVIMSVIMEAGSAVAYGFMIT